MILKLKAIKQIIKEELEKVVNEDLYADEDEYEEAIQDFMELHNVSREEAKKAIDVAGDEMDAPKFKEFSTSIEEEKENIKAFETLMTLARKGKNLHGKEAYLEKQELHDLSMDFKNNLQNYLKKNEYYKIIFKGYEFCKTYMFDKHGYWDKAADAYGKLNKPLLQRDIGAAITMAKLEPELQSDIEERTEKCEETLAFALSYVEEQIAADKREAAYQARRKKEKEDREKAEKELIKKGIPQEYIYAALKAGIKLQDTLDWDIDEWKEWYEQSKRNRTPDRYYSSEADYQAALAGLDDERQWFGESKFRLTQNEIKQIIKEELEAVINEDLYADEEEYEEAIKDFMELHNVSREEAKQAIDAAGDDIDRTHPVFGRYVEKDKLDIKNYKFFIKFAKFNEKEILRGTTEEEILTASQDFKINYEEFLKMHRNTEEILAGYEHCLNKRSTIDVREPSGESSYDDVLAALDKEEGELKKSFLTRDLGAGFRANKIKKQLDALQKKKKYQCDYYLGLAALRIKEEYAEYVKRNKNSIVVNKLKEKGFIVLNQDHSAMVYFKVRDPITKRYSKTDYNYQINHELSVEENVKSIIDELLKKYPHALKDAEKRSDRLMSQKNPNPKNFGFTDNEVKQWGDREWQGFMDHRDPYYY